MKLKILLLFVFSPLLLHSQNKQQVKYLFLSQKEKTTSSFYLTTIKQAINAKQQIIKQLDSTNCIIYYQNNTSGESLNSLTAVNNLWKLPAHNFKSQKKYTFRISTTDIKKLSSTLTQLKIPFSTNGLIVTISTSFKTLQTKILPLELVQAITTESFDPKLESKIRDQNFTINHINGISVLFPSIKGSNQIISIKDELFDKSDIDLLGKYISSTSESSKIGLHATAMATITSGLGNSSILGQGVAPESKVQSSDFNNLFPDLNNSLLDVCVQNHSYGTTIENFYGLLANAFDKNLFENTSINHVFSAGNRGLEGYKTITGNFKQSKNSIVVGCVDTTEQIMPFSSKGPANDGRIKPELVAYSTEGTSNSAAITSGIIALMNELHTVKNKQTLRNDTTKAILINCAKDLGNKGPDFTYGYGNIDAVKCLKTIDENRFILDKIGTLQTNIHTIEVPMNAKNLKISLVWTDLEAPVNSNYCLVNDLDLIVKSATENYLPWILNPSNPEAPAIKGEDHLNTIEQIEIENPQQQQYTILVSSKSLQNNFQAYSVVYEYELLDSFEWSYPLRNNNFPIDGKSPSPFLWKTNQSHSKGNLCISYDDGTTWKTIENNIDLQIQKYLYLPEQELFKRAKLKMIINQREYVSDTFIISYDLDIKTTLACSSFSEITWSNPANITTFNVYALRNNKLEFKEQVTNNSYAFSELTNFTIAPLFDGNEGIKSESSQVQEPRSDCYFESTLAEIENENQIKISANLFSLFNIKKIEVLKQQNNQQTLLGTFSGIDSKTISFIDPNPRTGINRYLIKLTLLDGSIITSSSFDTNFYFEQLFYISPTLITGENKLLIETKTEGISELQLFNTAGSLIQTETLLSKSNEVNTNNLAPGVYVYKLRNSKNETQTGKLIKS